MTKIKIIKCQCSNLITVKAETKPNPASVYKFETIISVTEGSPGFDRKNVHTGITCNCGKTHNINAFINRFHAQAVKAHATR